MVRVKPTWLTQANKRGQVVLLAALVLVVALVPIVAAYLQLGYQGETHTGIDSEPEQDTQRLLERSVQEATNTIPATYEWSERQNAAERVRGRLEPTAEGVEWSRLDSGVTQQLTYNESRADEWTDTHCPGGPDRQFGPCESIGGIVLQERAGRTHVLAVAVDLTTTATARESTLTTIIRVQTG
ncbi:DUF7261 family protein [Halovenus sp. HT40]|uniref:DUF7261 family protein n=1 Tax=Halovenus sp. HT40 TaxID=3126691 RepID=UPI00300E804B